LVADGVTAPLGDVWSGALGDVCSGSGKFVGNSRPGAAVFTGAGSKAGVASSGAAAAVVARAVVAAIAGVAAGFADGVVVFAVDCANATPDRFRASAAITQFRIIANS